MGAKRPAGSRRACGCRQRGEHALHARGNGGRGHADRVQYRIGDTALLVEKGGQHVSGLNLRVARGRGVLDGGG